ncbi:MAG: outer membrane beta-barrel protein [Lutibacter sp.]|uniref:outer membrane beta-barrel protein n=1 Tax=Lutibacter sp. TaxID=1925666 RepID=UPI00299D3E67|nr:outer membrane beta-barrel protein [Lutibacter sp.]MDX1829630.1 outer membrane beta-barrel protein [Lutibacter sp.]
MSDFKNIDRLFQEKLKDYEVSPPNKVWSGIENNLTVLPQKRRIPIWAKFASIAALILLFISIGAIYLVPTNNFTENLFKLPLSAKATVKNITDTLKPFESTNKQKVVAKKVINLKEKQQNNIEKPIDNIIKVDENTSIADNTTTTKSLPKYLPDTKNFPLPKKSKNKITKSDIDNSKFTVATIFAPIYMSSFGEGSGIDSQFKNNPSSGNSSYSYGVKVAYQLNKKFTLQSGVNLINLGITTNNVFITPGVSAVGLSNISSSPNLGKSTKSSKDELNTTGSLNQVFGYVEIPVEVKYNVTNGKFGVNLVGGFSTLLLNRDEIFVETSDYTQSLGASNNLRSINFSGNFGVDIDYLIRKNLYLNVSPMFKVQTNTFSKNSGSLLPYYLGVYTGINYKF